MYYGTEGVETKPHYTYAVAELEKKFKGARQIYEIVNFNLKFTAEAQLHPQTSKTIILVLKFLHPLQFNTLSYVKYHVGTLCHIYSVMVHKKINISINLIIIKISS